jgi:hypothetical protein
LDRSVVATGDDGVLSRCDLEVDTELVVEAVIAPKIVAIATRREMGLSRSPEQLNHSICL